MSTRGCFGWRFNGEDKIGFNHYDSYPSGLGTDVLNFIRSFGNMDAIKDYATGVELIDDEDADSYDGYSFKQKFRDFASFMHDSLFCEWAYIINVDTGMLEIYKGFNHNDHAEGRYVLPGIKRDWNVDEPYYGVALVKEIPLEDILAGNPEKFTDDDERELSEKEKKND